MGASKGMLTAKGLAALPVGEWASDPAPRGAGCLDVRKLAGGQLRFYYRYTKSNGQRDRLLIGTGLALTAAREAAAALSRRYQAGERDLRDAIAAEAAAADRAKAEALAESTRRSGATLGALMTAYAQSLEDAGKVSAAATRASIKRHIEDPWPALWARPASELELDDLLPILSRLVRAKKLREGGKIRSYLRAAYAAAIAAKQDAAAPDALRVLNVSRNPARDLATLSAHLITDHPQFFHYYKQKSFTYNKITQPNRNRLLWLDPTVDGMKTGHTEAAGYCMIASARRPGGTGERRLISVVLGTTSDQSRTQESQKLLNWGFQNFDTVKLYSKGQAVATPEVWKGSKGTVKIGFARDVLVTVPKGTAAKMKPVLERKDPLVAPLAENAPVGKLKMMVDDKVLLELPVVALEPINQATIFGRAWDSMRLWMK